VLVDKRSEKDDHLRVVHNNNATEFKGKSPYTRNIERAIFQKKKLINLESIGFWESVVYHNLVLRHMASIKDRPKKDDYVTGWYTFLELTEILDIEQCIVYGLEEKKIKSFIQVLEERNIEYTYTKIKLSMGKSYLKKISIILNNKKIKLFFIRHPSSFFSWKNWGTVLLNDNFNLLNSST
jgi:hypothetical protein